MADFTKAYELMIVNEGGYVNDPDDPGGETYKGVARKIFSKWDGWPKIDLLKRQPGFPGNLDKDTELQQSVEDFYQVQFWNRISGSLISEQAVANSIFDFAVNAGVGTSGSLAQVVVGTPADGVIGDITVGEINKCDVAFFLSSFALAKIARYVHIVKKRPASRKYFYGWVCRTLVE